MPDPLLPQLIVIFIAGFAGSFHCVGMCGGFACALGRDPSGSRLATVLRHLVYNTGRVVSYVFLGMFAGAVGAGAFTTSHADSELVLVGQRVLAVLAGVLMVFMGLRLLGRLQRLRAVTGGLAKSNLAGALRGLLRAPGRSAPLAFGVFNGFLPCPLVYAFVALAATTANPLHGALVMVAFGLGTYPAMLASGGTGTWLRHDWRVRGVRFAGMFILVLGALTLARGILPLGGHVEHRVSSAPTVTEAPAVIHHGGHAH